MNKYYFDEIIDRRNTSSIKYDFGMQRMGRDDLIPLWVADMDFKLPEDILEELRKRVDHGIFGYTDPDDEYFRILNSWTNKHYDYSVKPQWVTITPGLVYAIAHCIRGLTNVSDGVMIQQPVYYPFREMIESNGRILIDNPLLLDDNTDKYHIDFSDFEKKIVEHKVRLFILCNPHNPVGRVWSEEELFNMAEICLKHNVIIVSDEIHCDFIYKNSKFTSILALNEKYSEKYKSIIVGLHSLSKTFNIAGLQLGNCIIPDERLRHKFKLANYASGYSQGNVFGMAALKAAYTKGEEWHREVLEYIEANKDWTESFILENLKKARIIKSEGTYLLWVDFSKYGFSNEELENRIVNKAKLWLDSGAVFGPGSAQFQRFNIACPRSVVVEAFTRLKDAIEND